MKKSTRLGAFLRLRKEPILILDNIRNNFD